ncbi:MAG TPA: hypothetical protein EYQ00_10985 [Dehalococcoidia bacterium]|nr:hypothetical protein [Dehalococcoidia bacterium]
MKLNRKQLRKLIKEALMQESFISGPRGTMHVPDHDPYDELDHRTMAIHFPSQKSLRNFSISLPSYKQHWSH